MRTTPGRAAIRWPAMFMLLVAAAFVAACEKVPLGAPTGATLTVTATSSTVAPGGSTEVTAFVVESAGTPVHDGTLVRFSATLGRVEPVEVETRRGLATTTFIAGTTAGEATVRATSGAVSGSIETPIRIGAQAAAVVVVDANPSRVPASGGTVAIIASAVDGAGNRLAGVPVTFSTNAGSLSSSSATTDANGEARVNLTTNRDATVTARAGGQSGTVTVTVGVAPTMTLATSPSSPLAGSPVTLTVTPAQGTMPRVVVSWGDGTTDDLGTVSGARAVTHTYSRSGSYSISATASADGETFATATTVTVGSSAGITLSAPSPASPVEDTPVSLTVTPASGSSPRVVIDWGDGTSSDLGVVTGARGVTHVYTSPGSYIISATGISGGDAFTTSTSVTVTARPTPPPVSMTVSASPQTPNRCQPVQFTASATPASEGFRGYSWQIVSNNATENETVTTSGPQLTRVFRVSGVKTINVTTETVDGRRATAQTQIVVQPDPPPPAVPPSC